MRRKSEIRSGPEGVYQEIIVRPAIRNAIRDVVAQFTAEALYTTAREEIGSRIQNQLDSNRSIERGVTIQDVLLRDVTLPAVITQAIENKLAAEQAIQERRFRVDEAKEEAQRRIEEANGIAEANRRINESLTRRPCCRTSTSRRCAKWARAAWCTCPRIPKPGCR